MCHNLSKYTPIFLFLTLSGIIFLLRNIHTVEVRREVKLPVSFNSCFFFSFLTVMKSLKRFLIYSHSRQIFHCFYIIAEISRELLKQSIWTKIVDRVCIKELP